MRTVSFFGPEGGGIGGGGTEADNGREAAGGFGGGKKFVEEILSGADCEGEGTGGLPVSRTGNWIRTVSCGFTNLAPAASLQADAATGCEPSLFLVGHVRPFSVGEFDQKSPTCHYPILHQENVTRVRPADRSRGFL